MGKHARILIVDDDEGIRKVLATILKDEGYIVDTAENGKEAIEKTEINFYNLALIDIRLPDMEGTALLTKIKDTTPKMRKIIITGYPSVENAVEALNKGAHNYLVKPLDIEKVITMVKKQLKIQEQEKKYSQEKVTEYIETRVRQLEEEKPAIHKKKQ